MITIRQLEIFATIIERGSFRRCAEHLSISPVSVSDHMRTLEAQLGLQLFERTKGGPIQLTEAGARATEGVRELLAHVHDFTESVVGEGPDSAPIRVAMHGFMMRNLSPHVAAWNDAGGREIVLKSDESLPEQLQRRVLARDLDAAYFYSAEGMHGFGHVIGEEPLAIYVAGDHPLATREVVTARELANTGVVSLSEEKPIRPVVDAILARVGVTGLHHAVETAEFGLILSSLSRGLGFTCMFANAEDELLHSAGLSVVRFERPLPPLQIRRVTRRTAMRLTSMRAAFSVLEGKPGSGG